MKRECKLTPDRNPLATYSEKAGEHRLSEQHLYGAKRLGMRNSNLLVASTDGHWDNSEDKGEKRYELTNHLGNVLAVVSGEKAVPQSIDGSDLQERDYCKLQFKLTKEIKYMYEDEINSGVNSLLEGGKPEKVRKDLWYKKEQLIQKNVDGKKE